jgi:hypothetical protein
LAKQNENENKMELKPRFLLNDAMEFATVDLGCYDTEEDEIVTFSH